MSASRLSSKFSISGRNADSSQQANGHNRTNLPNDTSGLGVGSNLRLSLLRPRYLHYVSLRVPTAPISTCQGRVSATFLNSPIRCWSREMADFDSAKRAFCPFRRTAPVNWKSFSLGEQVQHFFERWPTGNPTPLAGRTYTAKCPHADQPLNQPNSMVAHASTSRSFLIKPLRAPSDNNRFGDRTLTRSVYEQVESSFARIAGLMTSAKI